jgi:hypothetical protein
MKYMYNKIYFQIHAHAQILIIQRNFEKKRIKEKPCFNPSRYVLYG